MSRVRAGAAGRDALAAGTPALYECVVRHNRVKPLRYGFGHRTYYWLVDLDHAVRLPRLLRPLAGFHAHDHLGRPDVSIRANLDAFLAAHDIDLRGGQVRLLTQPRVFGHVFNPLSVYWCHDDSGRLVCVVAEVHNTYGGQHSYLLRTEAKTGAARVAKAFYVSPFFTVDGDYEMRLPEPDDVLSLLISLERAGARPFTASVIGRKLPATKRNIARMAARYPFHTLAISARIRWHGFRLYMKGLPVAPREASGDRFGDGAAEVGGGVAGADRGAAGTGSGGRR